MTLRSDVAQGQANTLPLAPASSMPGTTGFVIYRVYLPAGGDFSKVPLPGGHLHLERPVQAGPGLRPGHHDHGILGRRRVGHGQPGRCRRRLGPGRDASGTARCSVVRPVAARPQLYQRDTGYLGAVVTPPGNGDVLVIRGKAPTASGGSHPSPSWQAPHTDLRYWSLCNYVATSTIPLVANSLPGGKTDYGCRYDSQVTLDRRGYYTLVVGTEDQPAAIDRIPGATFLPFSATQPTITHVLLLRDMLADPDFAQAVQNIPADATPATAASVMGPYYPNAAICPLTTLARGGSAGLPVGS